MKTVAKAEDKKQLLEPDSFMVVGGEASSWLMRHERKVIGGAIALLVIGGIIAVVSLIQGRAETRAARELGVALELLTRPVAGSPEALQTSPDVTPFATERARDEAVHEAMGTFREAHPDTRAARLAALAQAQSDFRLGNHAEAQAGFESFLQLTDTDVAMRANAIEGLGYSLEAQGKTDEAISAFEKLSSTTTGAFMPGMGDYHKARLLQAKGQQPEALELWRSVTVSHPNTAAARLSEERLQILAAQGVEIPAAPASPAQATTEAEEGAPGAE